jgi:signal transduction histidine kinase
MSEVAAWACNNLVAGVREAGLPAEALVDGLSVSLEYIHKRSNRLSWDEYTTIVERAAEMLGGPQGLARAGSGFGVEPTFGLVKVLAGSVVSARALYLLGAKWVGPSAFLSTRAFCEDLPDGRLRQRVEILPGYRDCELFFHGVRGVLETTPRMIGQPDARVEMSIEPRRCVYTITPPKRNRWHARGPRPLPKDFLDALAELSVSNDELRASLGEARATGESLRAQSHRLESLNRLSHELARHTELSELADALVALLDEHFGFEAVRLSIALPVGGNLEVVRQSGQGDGEPAATHVLRTFTGDVGRLDLWGTAREEPTGSAVLLADLMPWIALVLDNARSFEALNDQTERLEVEIAERHRTEQQLAQAMRMDAIGRLAGGLAHDFNNVLTAVLGHAELASRRLGDDDPAQRALGEIRAVCERATALISQVLAFSRSQVLNPRPIDLNALILEMESMLRHVAGEKVDLVIFPGADLGVVSADVGRLEQVIVNLVANGRHAMPEGGRMAIETSNVQIGNAVHRRHPTLQPGRYVRIDVRDTGTGMDEETRERMFEPFYTTKAEGEGTGLGLSTVYGTVTHFGGAVDVDSEVGKGTTITILLPRTEGEVEVSGSRAASEGRATGTETLLFVEDNDAVRSATRRILEAEGYTILAAEDGNAALEICNAYEEPIHLLFTDVVMPGIDGRELARRVIRLRPELRSVIYTSGYESAGSGQPVPAPDDHGFLRKPYFAAQLLAEVRRVLDAG